MSHSPIPLAAPNAGNASTNAPRSASRPLSSAWLARGELLVPTPHRAASTSWITVVPRPAGIDDEPQAGPPGREGRRECQHERVPLGQPALEQRVAGSR